MIYLGVRQGHLSPVFRLHHPHQARPPAIRLSVNFSSSVLASIQSFDYRSLDHCSCCRRVGMSDREVRLSEIRQIVAHAVGLTPADMSDAVNLLMTFAAD